MKRLILVLASISLVAQSSYSAEQTAEAQTINSSQQIQCDGQKTLTLRTSSSLNNSSSAQDLLVISSSNSADTSVFIRSQEARKTAEDERAIQQKQDIASTVVTTVVIGAAINVAVASAVESTLMSGMKYPAFYEKILVALGKNSGTYKGNLGRIISEQEITFWSLAPLSMVAAYYVDKSLYGHYLEAKVNQNQEKLCSGDYSSITKDHWIKQ